MTTSISLSSSFERDFRKLSKRDQERVRASLVEFAKGVRSKGLNFEVVKNHRGYCTIRGTRGIRVLLRMVDAGIFEAVAVGNHDYIYGSYFG